MARRLTVALLLVLPLLAAPPTAQAQRLLRRLEERLRSSISPPPLPVPPPVVVPPRADTPRLGVVVDAVSRAAVNEYGLSVRRGALITGIEPGSPAAEAGLSVGAVIVAVNGIRIDSADQLVSLIRSGRLGETIEVTCYEGARLERKSVQLVPSPRLANRPSELPLPADDGNRPERLPPSVIPPTPDDSAGSDRPLIDRLGRMLDGFVAPAAREVEIEEPEARLVPVEEVSVERLQQRITTLQTQVERLTARLEKLETLLDDLDAEGTQP